MQRMQRLIALVIAFVLAGVIGLPALGQIELIDESLEYDAARPAAGHWLGNVEPGRLPATWGTLLCTSKRS